MTRKGDFLLITWDGGGNTPPMFGIARQLRSRGHRVRILAPSSLREQSESAGAEFRPFFDGPTADPSVAPEDHIEDYFALWAGDLLARELQFELDREPADALLVDCMLLGALAAAERSTLPTAVLVHFLYAPCVAGSWGRWEWVRARVDGVRDSMGLAALGSGRTILDEVWMASSLVLVTTAQAFDEPLEDLASNVRYVGPVRNDASADWTWDLPWEPDDPVPLVCVSLSTSAQNQQDVLRRIVDAVANLNVHVLVMSGEAVDSEQLRVPPNAVVRRWVPHAAVLSHAAAMVTHAGHGTTIASLAHGVPLVCVPMGRDQHLVADRVAALECGLVASSDAGVDDIRTAIEGVLKQPTYREQAQRLAKLIGSPGNERAAIEMESLLAAQ